MKSLLISDIHGNLASLDAVLEAEKGWDEILFLGDAIVAGPEPDQVIRHLATLNGVWIAGNHDVEPFSREFTGRETDPDQVYMRWTRDQISPEGRRFLERLEPTHVIERDGLGDPSTPRVLPTPSWTRQATGAVQFAVARSPQNPTQTDGA